MSHDDGNDWTPPAPPSEDGDDGRGAAGRGKHLRAVRDPIVDPPPSCDLLAERAVLGALLTAPTASYDAVVDVTDVLSPSDFYDPRHETIYDAILELHATTGHADTVTVAHHLQRDPDTWRRTGYTYLHDLISPLPSLALAPQYAAVVVEHAHRRALSAVATRLAVAAATAPAAELPDLATTAVSAFTARARPPTLDADDGPPSAWALLDEDEDEDYEWVIPDLLERDDRVIITAGEGHGKSHLGRQIAAMAAAGIHPFTLHDITPIRTLILDFENPKKNVRRGLSPILAKVKRTPEHEDRFRFLRRPDGINLANPGDRTWFEHQIATACPDLLIAGPIYKMMAEGNPNAEEDVRPLVLWLDKMRVKYRFALWLEAHIPQENAASPKTRMHRPIGWSGWRRWPEFGIYLGEDGTLSHWRGMRDAERPWPTKLRRGGEWPFTVDEYVPAAPKVPSRTEEGHWDDIRQCILNAGYPRLSNRKIADELGISEKTVRRIVQSYNQQHEGLLQQLRHPELDVSDEP